MSSSHPLSRSRISQQLHLNSNKPKEARRIQKSLELGSAFMRVCSKSDRVDVAITDRNPFFVAQDDRLASDSQPYPCLSLVAPKQADRFSQVLIRYGLSSCKS